NGGSYVIGDSRIGIGDFDRDGRKDLAVIGTTSATVVVHTNLSPAPANTWIELGSALAGVKGLPVLGGSGKQTAGSPIKIQLTNAKASSPALLCVGLSSNPTPFKGGLLLPVPMLLSLNLATNAAGAMTLPATWPSGVPSGFSIYYQVAIQDAAAVY